MKVRGFVIWGLLLCLFSLFFIQGCASIISGTTQEVTFTSIPEGANVSVDGRTLGKTPLTMQLDKKANQSLVFEKDGYKTLTLPLETTLDPWFWGNIILGGLFGSTTDAISGAVNQYSPGQYNITLQPLGHVQPIAVQPKVVQPAPVPPKAIQPATVQPTVVQPAAIEKNDAKTFIIANYKNILPELYTGQGQYVSALMTLLKVERQNQTKAINMIKDLAEQYKDIPTFADKVVSTFY